LRRLAPIGTRFSEWDRKNIEAAEAFQAEFKRRKLREPAQLPDIAEPSFTLSWEFVDEGSHKETVIKCGDKSISAEPAYGKAMSGSSKSPKSCGAVTALRCAT
jgi:hypothetical protein